MQKIGAQRGSQENHIFSCELLQVSKLVPTEIYVFSNWSGEQIAGEQIGEHAKCYFIYAKKVGTQGTGTQYSTHAKVYFSAYLFRLPR